MILLIGCSSRVPVETVTDPNVSYEPYSHEAIDYFSSIAFGAEFGKSQGLDVIVRWGSGMQVYITNANQEDTAEARRIIDELSQLTGLSINFTNQTFSGKLPSNTIHIVYTEHSDFGTYCGIERYGNVTHSSGKQAGFFCNHWDPNTYVIITAFVLIDNSIQPQSQRNHLLREELTQSLGIMKDSNSYTDSIFHADYSYAPTEFSELDKQLIQILYDKRLSPGMTQSQILQNLQATPTQSDTSRLAQTE